MTSQIGQSRILADKLIMRTHHGDPGRQEYEKFHCSLVQNAKLEQNYDIEFEENKSVKINGPPRKWLIV